MDVGSSSTKALSETETGLDGRRTTRSVLNTALISYTPLRYVIGCLHDPANAQQTSSKCIQNTRANCWTFAGRLLDRVNTLLET